MPYEPTGTLFRERTGRVMILVDSGPYAGWICYRHPDGQWVTLRKATPEDRGVIFASLCLDGVELLPEPGSVAAEQSDSVASERGGERP